MPIVSSVIVSDRAQVDGRRKITEHHTDHVGVVHVLRYILSADQTATDGLSARAANIVSRLAKQELLQHVALVSEIGSSAVIILVHVTAAQARQALRDALRDAKGIVLANLAEFCLTLSDAQLQNLFGVSAGAQTTALRSRLQVKVGKRNALLAEVGE